MKITDLWPRRSPGLPPGQGEITAFPRFSDQPLRWAPRPAPIELTITVDGAERARLTADDLAAYPSTEMTCDFHCVTTWSHRDLHWGGVRLVDVLHDIVGADLPTYMLATAADSMAAKYLTEDITHDDVLLATHLGGELLDRRHGAPLRLVSPRQYGYKSPKHLTRLDFGGPEPAATLGKKEHLRARVAEEERHASLPSWLLRMPYRLVIAPTALAGERSLRRSPD